MYHHLHTQVTQVFLKVVVVLHRGQQISVSQIQAAVTSCAFTLCDSLLNCRSLTTPVTMGEGTPGEHPPLFHPPPNTHTDMLPSKSPVTTLSLPACLCLLIRP